ncbi:MAG: hypothetical protein Q7K39_01990 [Candidatus Magasanikbacteria bacterium]|nr:hypothetical protein [Candidatus Magasanikbacteria bacterium]
MSPITRTTLVFVIGLLAGLPLGHLRQEVADLRQVAELERFVAAHHNFVVAHHNTVDTLLDSAMHCTENLLVLGYSTVHVSDSCQREIAAQIPRATWLVSAVDSCASEEDGEDSSFDPQVVPNDELRRNSTRIIPIPSRWPR